MHAKTGESLERGIVSVHLERRRELPPETQPLGDDEGVDAVGLGQGAVVPTAVSHQLGVERIDLGLVGRQRHSVFEHAGQVPPIQAGRFHRQPQLGHALRLRHLRQLPHQGVCPRLAVRHAPARDGLRAVGQKEADHRLIWTDVDPHIAQHPTTPFPTGRAGPSVMGAATASRVIRTLTTSADFVARAAAPAQPDASRTTCGSEVSATPGAISLYQAISRRRRKEDLFPTGLAASVSLRPTRSATASGQQRRSDS